jgi:hypothetical protein
MMPTPLLTPPRIGQPWPGMGGLYAGVVRGQDGESDQHLILAADLPPASLKWQAALDWAAALRTDGFSDWHVPTRDESALLYANLRDSIQTGDWYWTSTQYSRLGAWSQGFDNGSQYSNGKSYGARARAVRRFSVQPFSPSAVNPDLLDYAAQLRRVSAVMSDAAQHIESLHAVAEAA